MQRLLPAHGQSSFDASRVGSPPHVAHDQENALLDAWALVSGALLRVKRLDRGHHSEKQSHGEHGRCDMILDDWKHTRPTFPSWW